MPGDWMELGELQARSYHDAYRGLLPGAFLERVTAESRQAQCRERLRESESTERTAILYIGHKAAGYISLTLPSDASDDAGEITALYLLREYCGRGLGTRLMDWALARLAERDCRLAGLWVLEKNVGARRFYERYGFRATDETRVIQRGDDFVQLRYEKEMSP